MSSDEEPMDDVSDGEDYLESMVEDHKSNVSDDDTTLKKRSYTILSKSEIIVMCQFEINNLSDLLSVPTVESTVLLVHYSWDVNRIQEDWFSGEARVRSLVGLPPEKTPSPWRDGSTCRLCNESFLLISARGCGHLVCTRCWRRYLSVSCAASDCLTLHCPCCETVVGGDVIISVGSADDRKNYHAFLLDSYVDSRETIKWCCDEFLVDFVLDGTDKNHDVVCKCGCGFCFECEMEQHWPLGCEMYAEWIKKNEAEGENTAWILDNCRPCPKCKRPIQKYSGCMTMKCADPCGYSFCWKCLSRLGMYHKCNRENTDPSNMAKIYEDRYFMFYERWAWNRKKMRKAYEILESRKNVKTDKQFIIDAWKQIVEGRRVIQLAYVYGYFIPTEARAKLRFFESLLGHALAGLEKLQKCVKSYYFKVDRSQNELNDFQAKVSGQILVMGTRLNSLLEAIDNDLKEVDCVNIEEVTSEDEEFLHDVDHWLCDSCTYANLGNTEVCAMCQQNRRN